jgi:hypothetical protein
MDARVPAGAAAIAVGVAGTSFLSTLAAAGFDITWAAECAVTGSGKAVVCIGISGF